MSWQRFNDQFRETTAERNARLKASRLRRAASLSSPQSQNSEHPGGTFTSRIEGTDSDIDSAIAARKLEEQNP